MPFRRRTTRYRRTGRRPARATRYRRKSGYYPRIKGRRRPLTKRRMLNTTSTKKRDNMQPVVTTASGSTPVAGPATLLGNQSYQFIWCATRRLMETSLNFTPHRNSINCYMRGLKEHISITTNNSTSWKWRRICFTVKGFRGLLGVITNADSLFTSAGWIRLLAQHNNDDMGNILNGILFDGAAQVDWNDVMTAKTSSTRVKVMYDKTVTINSGVEGVMRDYRRWYPMNKTLTYDDDENGPNSQTSTGYSTVGRAGMGDYYVVDYIRANTTASDEDTMTFSPEATLYWHEK
ncbi:capsid protein [Plant associated genomovirus 4]|uniref:Capsid protein n=1 Tax=Plant associated genomovirus 4 TaxID=2584398 RepID=A0A4Y5QCW5_9VIRU|nr:capsid protein [Plant associated genomovirus 4]QCX29376.1 capsid protein [Plant associated genomovirus 4]